MAIKSITRESLKTMREIGAAMRKVEGIRHGLIRMNVDKGELKNLDELQRFFCGEMKIFRRHFYMGVASTIGFAFFGIVNGVLAVNSYCSGNYFWAILTGLLSIWMLNSFRKELFG